jgi:hypothetical protein
MNDKLNVLGGKITLGGEVVPAENALIAATMSQDPRVFWFVMVTGFFLILWIGLCRSGRGGG